MKDIIENYKKEMAKKAHLKNLIEKWERRIVELNNQVYKLGSWYDCLFIPVCKKLEKVLPNIVHTDFYGPFGMQAETSAYFTDAKDFCYVLEVIPSTSCDWLQYDTGKIKPEYVNAEKCSIAKLNGFDKVYEDLPTNFDEVVKIVLKTKFKKGEH